VLGFHQGQEKTEGEHLNVDLAFIIILGCSTVGLLVFLYMVNKIIKIIEGKA
jgi:hypothetical protein